MGAIADLAVPEGGAVAALPVPETSGVVTPDQLDRYGTQSSGSVYRGLRGGFSSLAQGANNLLGNIGETLGLTDFAASRFADADQYAKNADANSPTVRDYRDVKDLETLTDYVGGLAGQAVSSGAPAVAGAVTALAAPRVVAGLAGGLRAAYKGPGGLLGRTARAVGGAAEGASAPVQGDAVSRAVLGIGAGSFVPNAGEQATNIRDLPGTPLEKTANALGVGAVNAGLDTLAPGGVVTRVGRPSLRGPAGRAIAKTIGLEAGTEGAQDVVGQGGEMLLDPSKKLDPHSVVNSAIGGAVGGTLLAGAGHAAAAAPGAVSDVAEAAKRFASKSKGDQLEEKLGSVPAAVDAEDLSSVVNDANLKDPEQVLQAIDGLEGDETNYLTKMGEKIGGAWAKAETWVNDPEKRAELKEQAKKYIDEHKYAPRIKEALAHTRKALDDAAKAGKAAYDKTKAGKNLTQAEGKSLEHEMFMRAAMGDGFNTPKPSLGRTVLDAQILEGVNARLPERIKRNTTPEERAEIASWFKHAAMYAGARTEVEGPMKPHTGAAWDDATGEPQVGQLPNPHRETNPVPLPTALLHFGGKDTVAIIRHVQDVLKANLGEGSVKGDAKRAVYDAVTRVKDQRRPLERVIHENMKQDIYEDPNLRHTATEGFMALLAADRAPDYRGLSAEEGKQDQRLSPSGQRLMEAAGHMFEDRPKAMRAIEAAVQRQGVLGPEGQVVSSSGREFHLSSEELDHFRDEVSNDEVVTDADADAGVDFGGRRALEQTFHADKRLRTYENAEEARQAYRALTAPNSGYDPKEVQFRHAPQMLYDPESGQEQPTGRITIYAVPREGANAMSGEPAVQKDGKWVGSGQWGDITDKSPSRQAGFKHGTLTVTLTDGKVVRVSLKALTKNAVQTYDRPGNSKKYPHDVIMHGLTTLMTDPRVAKIEEKKDSPLVARQPTVERGEDHLKAARGDKTGQKVPVGPEQWNIPPSTVMGVINKREYTWGQITRMTKMSEAELKMQHMVERPVEAAKEADSLADIEDKIIPHVQDRVKQLGDILAVDEENLKAAKESKDPERIAKQQKFRDIAKSRLDRMLGAQEQVLDERDRRETYGDRPVDIDPGSFDVDEQIRDQMSQPDTKSRELAAGRTQPRLVQEETGSILSDARDRARGPGYQPHEVGQKPQDRANPGWKTAELAKGKEKMPVTKEGSGVVEQAPLESIPTPMEKPAKPSSYKPKKAAEPEADMAQRQLRDNLKVAKEGPKPYKPKTSDLRVNASKAVSAEDKQKVRDYVESVLGKEKTKVLFKNLDHAGDFAFDKDSGVELLRIANLAMDPMGAARHEAAHALVLRLLKSDRAAAQTLMAAAGSPAIVARLRGLLKGHPEALAQLKDPEERVAYMYQFWAAGDMTVGPNTKTWMDKIKGFFSKLANIWTGTFYDGENADKAAQIFDLFDRGQLANRDTVAEVLRDKMTKSAVERAEKVMGPAADLVKSLLYTSVAGVKALNVSAFNEVMDKMWHDTTRGEMKEPGFNQAKHPARNQYLSQLEGSLRGTTAETRREAIEAMQAGVAPKTDEARRVVAGVQKLLGDVFKYMQAKGVKAVVWNDKVNEYEEHDVEFVRNYFPRFYDKEAIGTDRKAFTSMLERNGLKASEANVVADNISRSQAAAPGENDYETGLTYYAPNTQARKLNVPAADLAPFLRKDLADTLRSYIGFAVRRAEYASRFGNQGQFIKEAEERAIKSEGATPEQVKTFNRAVQALEGSLGHDLDPSMKKAMGAVQTYQHLRLLPLAIFSSLTVDPLGIAVRGGTASEAFGAFARVVRNLVSEKKDDAYDMAVAIGSISEALDTHMLEESYGTQDFGGLTGKINQLLFKWNGMDSLNRSMRVAATAAAHSFIVRHATEPTEHSERYLSELGLTKDDVKVTDGRLDLSSQKIRDAMNLWVDGAVLRPNAAIRPTWTSDPHWMLVSSMKQYMYAFQETIIKRVVHEANHGNFSSAYALMSYVPAIIAADVLRAALTPGGADDDAWKRASLAQVLGRGVQRAAITGPLGQYAMDAYGDMKNYSVPFASIGGPTFEQLANMGKALAGAPGSDVGHELARAVPGYILVR